MDGLMVNVWLGDPDELANQVSNIITLSGVRLVGHYCSPLWSEVRIRS